ncbi:MAG: RagB/SusD family nutrient uptake outer membrane protein [Prevotellaceae bacterium]|jgi:hypothetical protein|nr:RagB/SusD family nutrient uptake outer membrane protein [Prevotellaceae bacterium]
MRNKIITFLLMACVSLAFNGCSEDFFDTKSTSDVDQSQIFQTTETAMLAINGLHKLMHHPSLTGTYAQGGYESWMIWMDMLGEDLVYTYSNAQFQTHANWRMHRVITYTGLVYHYRLFYYFITNANLIVANIDAATGPDNEKEYIKGQALAYRAFAYFNLVQTWGGRYDAGGNNTQLGVVIRNDQETDLRPRNTVEEVYAVINEDLDEAVRLLDGVKGSITRNNKSHINSYVARGLKARVLLAQGKWREAAEMAKTVVEGAGASLQDDTYTTTNNRMMDRNNTEFIWCKIGQADQAGTLKNFESFMTNANASFNGNTPRAIYNQLYNRIPDTDIRKTLWFPNAQDPDFVPAPVYSTYGGKRRVNYMANKFLVTDPAIVCADVPYMRLPEMMLIMAEGYARAGDTGLAADILYQLAHHRDPAYVKSTSTGATLIEEVLFQRRIELWGEGFRFLDLKRLNMPLNRGDKPREGYSTAPWKALTPGAKSTMPTNVDPLATNWNMYESGTVGDEETRLIPAGDKRWQFVFPDDEIDVNPFVEQNEM